VGTGESAFIARPVDAVFLRSLSGAITTSADLAALAIVHGNQIVSAGSTVLDQIAAPGTAVSSGVGAVLPPNAGRSDRRRGWSRGRR